VTTLIIAPYAALLALLFVGLSVRTLRFRRKLGVGVGDGGDQQLIKAARAHANFAEYTPLCLFLIYLVETTTSATLLIHFYGVVLLAGRCVHAYGVSQVRENYKFRVFGMACTFIVLIGSAIRLLVSAFV
jgi:uncharacterized membrane protein YecN with MAPEG domain